jgi:hypothetical protein
MKKYVWCVPLLLVLTFVPACGKKVTGATPVATAALGADAVVIRVNELQAATIQYCGPAPQCAPGTLDTATARLIVSTAIDLRQTLKAVPAGWQATVKQAWAQARPKFAAITNPAIVAALAGVDIAIGSI